jgi:cytidine deaminase
LPTELRPVKDLAEPTRELLKQALAVQARAHAPYSKFLVGCALRDSQGAVHVGCNVENASYGATICAERSAITRMVAAGGKKISEIVVVTISEEAFFPCGLCLQVIREFGEDVSVVAVESTGKQFRSAKLSELYPSAFSRERWKHE